ncbi:hypothetical protein [Crocosphaera sp.]|uniref:hypothetical protein n=1 Tax=Crocosphaera sp. TaxID=2729996 RepID=UPI00260E31F7|nr:hypothetical protein [Crocosphaera sp.]MDJ0581338.1 hypothetical protein [Crocosphaera sp.]
MKSLDCQTLCALTPIVIAVCGAVIVVTAIIVTQTLSVEVAAVGSTAFTASAGLAQNPKH